MDYPDTRSTEQRSEGHPSMTTAEYSPRARAERLIASGRAFLALIALTGILLAPADPEMFSAQALQILSVYCVYTLLIWIVIRRGRFVTRRATATAHGIDLLVAIILMMLTRGSGSPFFLFFTFLLLAATLRWQAWGAWTTGLIVGAAYLGVVAWEVSVHTGPIDINRFIIRLGMLGVMTMVLAQLGAYQQRLYAEFHLLAASPRTAATTLDAVLRTSLEYAAGVLNGPVTILLWQDDDDTRTNMAVWSASTSTLERRTLTTALSELVTVPADVRRLLHVRGTMGAKTLVSGERVREVQAPILAAYLVNRYAVETIIGAALPERSHQGWLLVLNRPAHSLSTDDVVLTGIVAADVSSAVEHWSLSQRARDAAVAEERLRVSRDLHDGVLQSLTGCRLNIAATAAGAERTSGEIAAQLRALERTLAHDQQELREVIQQLRGTAVPRPPTSLHDLCARVERQWGLHVRLASDPDAVVPVELNTDFLLMVHEALVNAARHGEAKRAQVSLERRDRHLVIRVDDDGHGFPFKGELTGPELAARKAGPRSLRERAETLGGTLAVISHDTGSTIEISIPVTQESICA
jgi:signal transduction histidine kinase